MLLRQEWNSCTSRYAVRNGFGEDHVLQSRLEGCQSNQLLPTNCADKFCFYTPPAPLLVWNSQFLQPWLVASSAEKRAIDKPERALAPKHGYRRRASVSRHSRDLNMRLCAARQIRNDIKVFGNAHSPHGSTIVTPLF